MASPAKFAVRLYGAAFFLLLFAVSLGMQIHSGAWSSDFGGHADEGAHVVTSLMVRDYIAGGWREESHPSRFAETYYRNFPKVAIGHYPPGFYAVAGLALLPTRDPAALLVLMALLSAAAGWLTMRLGRKVGLDSISASLVGLTFCLLPITRTYTAIVMSDLLLTIFSLLSVICFIRFLEGGKIRDSLWFGIWAAAAILTKGSGLALGLLPLFSIPLLGRWALFKNFRLWVSALPVLLLALPWIWMTHGITAEGMKEIAWSAYIFEAVPYYFNGMIHEAGWIAILLGIVGIVLLLWLRRAKNREITGGESVLLTYPVCVFVLICLVPTGLDTRYLLPVLPIVLVIATWAVANFFRMRQIGYSNLGVSVAIALILLASWRPVEKLYTGAAEAIAKASKDLPAVRNERRGILVLTDARGEGALTASAAFDFPDSVRIFRGTKLLGSVDWMATDYQLLANTPEEMAELLKENDIPIVILEALPENGNVLAHWSQAEEWLHSDPKSIPATQIARVESQRKNRKPTTFTVFQSEIAKSKVPQAIETVP